MQSAWSLLLAFCAIQIFWIRSATAAPDVQLDLLRQETEQLFYHGFDGYMKHAFPEDELKPVSCKPLTRDRSNPAHIELNDPLGNYSLTLVDSLSTLAILSSGSGPKKNKIKAFKNFQNGVAELVRLYGDGSDGYKGQGERGRGFDVDSKVQVFETVIRGVGGLLSAHLFAVGELPIDGYNPSVTEDEGEIKIKWTEYFTYDGQLLRLARDLAKRLLPAFSTPTGIPYPRVNLRHGIPFYKNSPLSCNNEDGPCNAECPAVPPGNQELTETCTAGAGSLVLEFTVLSRLTGDYDFENVAKRAFWSIWDRRTSLGLLGGGIDAETGQWTGPYTGLGAGIDSFFEYAVKSYILLSGSSISKDVLTWTDEWFETFDIPLLEERDHNPQSFLNAWQQARDAVKHHLYRGHASTFPHYVQGDIYTGAARAFWIDSLSMFYPGLLVLAGDVEEGAEMHLLFAALWSRYSAIPERWSVHTGAIEAGMGWWTGRPEFIESTYYLYHATGDPFYIRVGEMALRDIKRRCWAECGLSGLQDVRSGLLNDRMDSFFLGETAKYLYLLFDPEHPLNKLDAAYVFTTEGHPLVLPRSARHLSPALKSTVSPDKERNASCPVQPSNLPLTISNVLNRTDYFHAAYLARLDLNPEFNEKGEALSGASAGKPSVSLPDVQSPTNSTYYPWTLPPELVPHNGICAIVEPPTNFDIKFPSASHLMWPASSLTRVAGGILVNGMGGLRLGMIQDAPSLDYAAMLDSLYRVQAINGILLGRDEHILIAKDTISGVLSATDPNFTRIRDETAFEVAVDIPMSKASPAAQSDTRHATSAADPEAIKAAPEPVEDDTRSAVNRVLQFLVDHASPKEQKQTVPKPTVVRNYFSGATPTGPGFAPLPEVNEFNRPDSGGNPQGNLLWRNVYVGGYNCDKALPANVPRQYSVIVLKRGGCSFSQKLENIPSFPPSSTSLQLVIVVSFDPEDAGSTAVVRTRPELDRAQKTSSGLPRRHPIPMVLIGGGDAAYDAFGKAVAVGVKRRYSMRAQGVPIKNLIVL